MSNVYVHFSQISVPARYSVVNYQLESHSLKFREVIIGGWGGVLPPHFGQKKSRRPFSDFLLGVPLCGRRVFSYKSSGQVDPMCVE